MDCCLSSILNFKKTEERTSNNIIHEQLDDEQIVQLLKIHFNRSEIFEWHRSFIEKCGASENTSLVFAARINKARFIDYFNQLYPNGDVTRLTDTFFRTYDLNGDGIIDFMEFMHAISIIRRGDLTEKLSFIFSLLDSNNQGYIDRFKLIKIMEELYNVKGFKYKDRYNVLLKAVDNFIFRLNKDIEGRILRYEFIESCMNDSLLREILNLYK